MGSKIQNNFRSVITWSILSHQQDILQGVCCFNYPGVRGREERRDPPRSKVDSSDQTLVRSLLRHDMSQPHTSNLPQSSNEAPSVKILSESRGLAPCACKSALMETLSSEDKLISHVSLKLSFWLGLLRESFWGQLADFLLVWHNLPGCQLCPVLRPRPAHGLCNTHVRARTMGLIRMNSTSCSFLFKGYANKGGRGATQHLLWRYLQTRLQVLTCFAVMLIAGKQVDMTKS